MLLIGIGLWTFIEYLMHCLVYHQIAAFKKYHEARHADPQAYVGAPPMVGTSLVFLVFLVSFMPLLAVSPIAANGLSTGMLGGYTAYMLVHHACHFWQVTPASYLYRHRLRHAAHHYRDDGGNFGVTTAFWDRVNWPILGRSQQSPLATVRAQKPELSHGQADRSRAHPKSYADPEKSFDLDDKEIALSILSNILTIHIHLNSKESIVIEQQEVGGDAGFTITNTGHGLQIHIPRAALDPDRATQVGRAMAGAEEDSAYNASKCTVASQITAEPRRIETRGRWDTIS